MYFRIQLFHIVLGDTLRVVGDLLVKFENKNTKDDSFLFLHVEKIEINVL
jgi:hypothetical protein